MYEKTSNYHIYLTELRKRNKKPFDIFVIDFNGTILSSRNNNYIVMEWNESSKYISSRIGELKSLYGSFDARISKEKSLVTFSSFDKKDWYIVSVILTHT